MALRDGTATAATRSRRGSASGSTTGIGLRNGYLYLAHFNSVERYKMTPGQLKPASDTPEMVVSGLPGVFQHGDKGIAFDGKGGLYVNVGAPSNACQQPDRRPGAKGQDPCPLLEKNGGIWKFDENKLGQTQEDGSAIGHRLAADAGDHVARRRGLHCHEQPRSARCVLAGLLQG